MLPKIHTIFTHRTVAMKSPTISAPPTGYYAQRSISQLTSSAYRKLCLQQIWKNSSLASETYHQFYSTPLNLLLERVQNVPAASKGRWSRRDGYGDLVIQFTTYAVRMAKGSMFPPGAEPEEQAAQNVMWNAVVYWSALFWHLPLLASLEGELENGARWQPGISVPRLPYRFRFNEELSVGREPSALAALIAGQLLPPEALDWVSANPSALQNIAGALWNQHPLMPAIRNLLKQAAEMAESPLIDISQKQPAANLTATGDGKIVSPESATDLPLSIFTTARSTIRETVSSETINPESCTKSEAELENEQLKPVTTSQNHPGIDGKHFFEWCKTGLNIGEIGINGKDDKIHTIAGYVFLPIPGIFFEYLKTYGLSTEDREKVQASFERLNVHKRNENKRYYFAHQYEYPGGVGRFKRVKGYLIKRQQLSVTTVLTDSEYLQLAEQKN